MACHTKLLRTQTRGKHNEELIPTHTQDSLREPSMSMDCGLVDLSRELCVQIGLEVQKVHYNNKSNFRCPKSHPNRFDMLCKTFDLSNLSLSSDVKKA